MKNNHQLFINIVRWALTVIVSFLILFPLFWIFISSITPAGKLFNTPIDYLPDHPTIESYTFLIRNVGLSAKIFSTTIIVGLSIVISTLLCVVAAYGFARYESKKALTAGYFILLSMLIPEVVTARPLYEFMRKVNLYDTYPGLIILYISGIIPFTVLILRGFISEIPYSLEEAASIDGANFLQILFRITMPLLKPAIATVVIINFITCLNNFFTPLFFQSIQVLSTAITSCHLGQYVRGTMGSC